MKQQNSSACSSSMLQTWASIKVRRTPIISTHRIRPGYLLGNNTAALDLGDTACADVCGHTRVTHVYMYIVYLLYTYLLMSGNALPKCKVSPTSLDFIWEVPSSTSVSLPDLVISMILNGHMKLDHIPQKYGVTLRKNLMFSHF